MISKLERTVAFRYLKPKKKEGFLKVISIFSFMGIALGVSILIIVMSVMNGFRTELINKILGFNPHIIVKPYSKNITKNELIKLSEKKTLIYIANAYIWVWRGTPPLIQLFLLYFGLAQLGFRLSAIQAGIFGLGCYSAAYMSEIIRAAIISIHADQLTAARSMGFSWIKSMRYFIIPQSIRIILPPFGNEFASMMRTTSLLSVISFEELLRVTRIAINETYSVMELYAVAATYYLIMYSAWILLQQYLEKLASKGTQPKL